MNPIKSFFNSLFAEIRDERDIVQKAPPAPVLPAPPEPPLEISCYIKGVIKSMRETPDKWLFSFDPLKYGEHAECNQVRIRLYNDGTILLFPGKSLNKLEKNELISAYRFVKVYYSEKLLIEEEEREAKIRAPFEKLGCPDNTQ